MTNGHDLEKRFQEPQNWQWGTIVNRRGMALRYGGLPVEGQPAAAHIVFVEGLGGFAEETFELSRAFNKEAQGFWVMDRAGQGLHYRYRDAPDKMHAEDFDHDVRDLIEMVKKTVPQDGAPVFLFGHSTGGLLALQAAHEAPELFSGVILSAPLTGLAHKAVRNQEKLIAQLPLGKMPLNSWRIPGFTGALRKEKGVTDQYSHDPARNQLRDWWQEHKPELRTGATTLGWLWQACRAINKVAQPAYLKEIQTPTLIFTAGQDILINNDATKKLAANLPHAEQINFSKGRHELFLETDKIRDLLLQKSQDFIKQHTTPPAAPPAP